MTWLKKASEPALSALAVLSALSVYAQAADRLGLGDIGLTIHGLMSHMTPMADQLIAKIGSWRGPLSVIEGDVVRSVVLFGSLAITALAERWKRLSMVRFLVGTARPAPLATVIAFLLMGIFASTVFTAFSQVRSEIPLAQKAIWLIQLSFIVVWIPLSLIGFLRIVWPLRKGRGRYFVYAALAGLGACAFIWLVLIAANPPFVGIGFAVVCASMTTVLIVAPKKYELMGMVLLAAASMDFAIWAHRFSAG